MGKRLYWAGVAGTAIVGLGISYSLIFLPHDIIKSKPTRTLEGEVIEEKYAPARFMSITKYFVSLNTEAEGAVSVNILPVVGRAVESIDILVQPGTRMKVKGYKISPRTYTAYADEVTVER